MNDKKQIEEQAIEEMANTYYEAMLKARGTLGSMNEGAPKWYAKAFYEAGYRKQEWISVEERLPECRKHVIVCDENGIVGEAYHFGKGRFEWMEDEKLVFVTHWMPLPEPPKMKGGAE